jgi:hypothetical protein
MSVDKQLAKQILNSRIFVDTPGKYAVKVTNVTPYTREDGTETHIVSVNAMTQYQKTQAIAALKVEDYDAATNTNMSGSVLDRQYCPSKGEIVHMNVQEIVNNDGVRILVVQSFSEIPVKTATKTNFDDFFTDEVPASATAETKEDKKKAVDVVVP